MQVIYATIIEPKKYSKNGCAMIRSFRENQCEELIVGVDQKISFNEKNLFFFDMTEYPAYKKWQRMFEMAVEVADGELEKISSLKEAKGVALMDILSETHRKDIDYVVWVDCESVFGSKISSKIIEEICGDFDAVSVLNSNGPMSFIVYNFRKFGRQFAKSHAEFYNSGEFKKYKHWDIISSFAQINNYRSKSVTNSEICGIIHPC